MMDARELIVVGIDGSTASLAALRWALKEGVARDAAVEVVHCYLPQTLTDLGFSTPHELHTASAIMVDNEVSAALREMSEVPQVHQCSDSGGPAKVLLEKAANQVMLVSQSASTLLATCQKNTRSLNSSRAQHKHR
jgi:nucleotide-binding universal stress UspA family protein